MMQNNDKNSSACAQRSGKSSSNWQFHSMAERLENARKQGVTYHIIKGPSTNVIRGNTKHEMHTMLLN